MALLGLPEALSHLAAATASRARACPRWDGHWAPGAWTVLGCRWRKEGVNFSELHFPSGDHRSYARAIRLEWILGQGDRRHLRRSKSSRIGESYSPLVLLKVREAADCAVSTISSCICKWSGGEPPPFVGELCGVVAELHDNVVAHADGEALSMAQIWSLPSSDRILEFAIADVGRGFLGELKRAGVDDREGIRNDEEAIRWCLQKHHSSKMRQEDDWTQQLPEDAWGNPTGAPTRRRGTGNHHAGLGLYKFTELVRRYGGRAWVASGEALLEIDDGKEVGYHRLKCPWQGVAIACRFSLAEVPGQTCGELDPWAETVFQLAEKRGP